MRVERLEARRGDRIGVVGPNGSGKTTLLRTIAGDLAPIDGRLVLGQKVQVGYLAQIRRMPMPGTTVLEALAIGQRARRRTGALRTWRASCSAATTRSSRSQSLSGGERSRLELALVGSAGGQPAAARRAHEPPRHPGA